MLDILGVTILILFFIRGYMKGIIVAVFSILAVVLGIICALKLSAILSEWLLEKGWVGSGWVQIISYLILFLGILLLVRLLAKLIERSLQFAMLGWVNGIIGGLLYAFMGAIIWSSLLWLANQMGLISPEAKLASRTFAYFEPLAPWTFDKVGKLLPFARDIFTDLENFFDKTEKTVIVYVGAHR